MMRGTSIKTSIEKAIGEDVWLTEDVVRKMVKKQPPHKERTWLHPLLATAVLVAIMLGSIFLFMTQPNSLLQTSASPDWRELERAIENDQVEAAFTAYLKASIDKNYDAFNEVSSTQFMASSKEVFERYDYIDWSTFRVISVIPSQDEPITTIEAAFQYVDSKDTVVQTYSVEMKTTKSLVSEPMYQTLPIYMPFAFPERVELQYEKLHTAQLADKEFTDEDLLHIMDMPDHQSEILVYKPQDGEYEFYARKNEETFYLTTIYGKAALNYSYRSILNQDSGEAGYFIEFEDLGTIGLVFFGEEIQFLETSLDYKLERRYLTNDDTQSILINDDNGLQVLRYENGVFEGATVRFTTPSGTTWNASFKYNLVERANHFQVISGFLEGEEKAIYDFEGQEVIIKR